MAYEAKYKIVMQYSYETNEKDDYVFGTKRDAEAYVHYPVGCSRVGAEVLNLPNSDDYHLDDFECPSI